MNRAQMRAWASVLRRNWARAGSAALIVVVFVASLFVGDSEGIEDLYVIPIALVALTWGPVAGMVAAGASFGLFTAWDRIVGAQIDPWDVGIFVYFAVALVVGLVSKRLRRASEEYERAAEFHRAIVETANEAFIAIDREGRVAEWNPAAERMLGWTPDEIIGRSALELLVPKHRLEEFVGDMGRYLETGQRTLLGKSVERSVMRRDGSEVPIEMSSAVIGDGDDLLFYTFMRDISERKEFEERLARAARHFEVSHDLIATLGPDFKLHDLNERWHSLLGWTPEELHAMPALELIHPDDRQGSIEKMARTEKAARAQGSDAPSGFRNRLRAKDGSWHWIEWSAVALDEDNLGYLAGREITEQVKAERSLQQAARYFEISHDLVCTATPDGYLDRVNSRWQSTLGWTVDELRSRPFVELVHPEDREATARVVGAIFAGEDLDGFVNRYRTKDGSWRWLEWSAVMEPEEGRAYAAARDVTEWMKAKRELEAAARHFQLSHDLICTSTLEGRFERLNDRWESTLGWSPEELRGKRVADLVHPDDLASTEEEIAGTIATGRGSEFVNRIRAKDGSWHWLEWTGTIEPDEKRLYSSARDVTDRIEAELAYGQLGAIVESSGEPIYGYSLDGVITTWNAAAERLFGYSASEAAGMPLSHLVPPDQPDDTAAIVARVARGEVVGDLETVRIGKGGRRLDVSITVSPLRDAAGTIIGASTIARDISERRRTSRYARAQHQATSLLAEAPPASSVGSELLPVLASCADWDFALYWHASDGSDELRCERSWTLPRYRGPGLRIREGCVWSPDGPEARGSGPRWEAELRAEDPIPAAEAAVLAGVRSALWMPVSVGGQLDGGFEFFSRHRSERDAQLVGALRSVTVQLGYYLERRLAEQEADRLKNEFFSLISHELRTPLTSIIGYTELLEETEAMSDQGEKFLHIVDRSSRRELSLVSDLLTLVHIEAGTFGIEPQPTDLEQVVADAVEAAQPNAEQHGIDLRLRSEPVPELEADPQRLGQVLDNLITNAIKFSPDGGEVVVHLARRGEQALIEVSDTGMGISASDQERLFERMFRAEGATAMRIPGTGLGLTIVKAIVDAHGGRVRVDSEEGVGTTFSIELPMEAPAPVPREVKEGAL